MGSWYDLLDLIGLLCSAAMKEGKILIFQGAECPTIWYGRLARATSTRSGHMVMFPLVHGFESLGPKCGIPPFERGPPFDFLCNLVV